MESRKVQVPVPLRIGRAGNNDAPKQVHSLIVTLIKDPDVDILTMLPKREANTATIS